MGKRSPVIRLLLFAFLFASLLSCSISIVDSMKSSDRVRGVYHRVKAGETLWRISKAYNVDLQELAEINNITDAARIEAGSVVFVPDAHEVIDLPAVKLSAETVPIAARAPAKQATVSKTPENGSAPNGAMGPSTGIKTVGGQSKVKEESITDRPGGSKTERNPSAVARPPERSTPQPVEKAGTSVSTAGKTQMAMKSPVPAPPVNTPEAELKEKTTVTSQPKKYEPARPVEETHGRQIRLEKGRFLWPVKGPVITRFGIQPSGMKYNGIKISAKEGAPVQAAAAGKIIYASYVKGYGDTVIVKHDENYTTVYAYLKSSVAKKDDRVKKGEKIASIGPAEEPGGEPYLYFEIREKNKARNPLFFLP